MNPADSRLPCFAFLFDILHLQVHETTWDISIKLSYATSFLLTPSIYRSASTPS